MDANKTVTAVFVETITPTYTLTIIVEGQGTTDPAAGTHTYEEGTSVTITATAATGWEFSHWTGDATGTAHSITITMDENKTITAVFAIKTYTLTIDIEGQGDVIIDPDLPEFGHGIIANLTAIPAHGWVFSHWEGDQTGTQLEIQLTIDGNKTVTAVFSLITLELNINSTEGGSVTLPGEGKFTYDHGTNVDLVATPDNGYRFVEWIGYIHAIADQYAGETTIEMFENYTIIAVFAVETDTISLDITSPEEGNIFGTDTIIVTWDGNDTASGISNYEIRLNQGDWLMKDEETDHTFNDLSEGENTVYVRAHNNVGNYITVSVNFTVDISSPIVEITSPEAGELFATNTVVINWSGSDFISGISHYHVSLNGGEWIYMGTETQHTFHDLPDGNHTVEVRAYDNAGNRVTAAASFTVDTVPPEIHHEPILRWHMGDEVVIEANVRDGHILGNVTLHYSHNGVSGNVSMVYVRDGLYRAILAATNVETTLEYRISAVDMAGHVSLSETYILELLDLGQPEIREISMGEFDVMPLNGTVIITFSKPMDVLGEPAITVEPNAIFSFKWTCERNLTISFYDLSPETEYVITVTGTSLVDTNGIFMGVDGTYRFTSQGFPEITSVQHIEEVRKGLEIVLQSDIRSQVGLREVFLWYTCASGILNHIGANNTVGTLWEVTITARNRSGVLVYGFSAIDISGLTVHSSEYQINITNPSWVSPPHDLNARAGKSFDFSLRVTNPVGVLMVVLHYTCPRGEERTIDMMRTSGEITDGIWNCRLNTDPGELTYRVEIMDIHGEGIMLPETPATITVQESSSFLDGMFLYLLILLILCAAIIGVVLWKRRQEEEEEPEVEESLAAEPTPVSAVVPEKAEDRCLICYGEMDDSSYLCPGCDNVYHEDCIRQVGDCPMCGGEVSSASEDPSQMSRQ